MSWCFSIRETLFSSRIGDCPFLWYFVFVADLCTCVRLEAERETWPVGHSLHVAGSGSQLWAFFWRVLGGFLWAAVGVSRVLYRASQVHLLKRTKLGVFMWRITWYFMFIINGRVAKKYNIYIYAFFLCPTFFLHFIFQLCNWEANARMNTSRNAENLTLCDENLTPIYLTFPDQYEMTSISSSTSLCI